MSANMFKFSSSKKCWYRMLIDFFQNLIDVTVTKYGRIDCLINNAGVRKSTYFCISFWMSFLILHLRYCWSIDLLDSPFFVFFFWLTWKIILVLCIWWVFTRTWYCWFSCPWQKLKCRLEFVKVLFFFFNFALCLSLLSLWFWYQCLVTLDCRSRFFENIKGAQK